MSRKKQVIQVVIKVPAFFGPLARLLLSQEGKHGCHATVADMGSLFRYSRHLFLKVPVAKSHLDFGGIMAIVALPVRSSDIAPIFDLSRRIVLVDLEDQNELRKIDLFVHRLSVAERIKALSKAGVGTLICGCISADAYRMLKKSGICVIWGVSGPIEDVLAAFASNLLDESAYCVLPHKDSHFQPHKHAWAV